MVSPSRVAELRRLLAAHLPGYRIDSVVPLGEGVDNLAYHLNGELVVRLSKEPDPVRRAALVERETRLLGAVAEVVPLAVPVPVFVDAGQGWWAYRALAGVPLLDLPLHHLPKHHSARGGTSIAATLGELLTALHTTPASRWAGLAEADAQPLARWREEAAEHHAAVAGLVPAGHRGPVEEFLAAPPPPDRYVPVFSHNDLGIEHVLVDPATWTVTGVIDWSDAAIVDPAYDFGLLYRDLGPAALGAALGRYRAGAGDLASLRARAGFYARCSVFEELSYGAEAGDRRYVEKSLAAMRWLFAAAPA